MPVIRRELTAGGRRGEVLIGQRLGILLDELDAHGGLDVAAALGGAARADDRRVRGMSVNGGLTVETASTRPCSPSCTTTRSTARRYCPA